MDDQTQQPRDGYDACTEPYLISDLVGTKKDKLGYHVEEILWLGRNYAIYRRLERGVYVQFSDCPEEERLQRTGFTEISPELCELRYLTYELRPTVFSGFGGARPKHHPSSLFDHNMAQAVMLVMEEKVEEGKKIAQQALRMAVERVTNENTILYFRSCLLSGVGITVGVLVVGYTVLPRELWLYVVAAMAGATGAVLSIATRLQTFQFKPCHQSNMNKLMGFTRVGIGLLAGSILFLLAKTILVQQMKAVLPMEGWESAAVLGLIGGFAERLIPNLLRRTTGQIESPAGTPVQAVRTEDRRAAN